MSRVKGECASFVLFRVCATDRRPRRPARMSRSRPSSSRTKSKHSKNGHQRTNGHQYAKSSSSVTKPAPAPVARSPLSLGDAVLVNLPNSDREERCRVLQCRRRRGSGKLQAEAWEVYIHVDGQDRRWDRWVPAHSARKAADQGKAEVEVKMKLRDAKPKRSFDYSSSVSTT